MLILGKSLIKIYNLTGYLIRVIIKEQSWSRVYLLDLSLKSSWGISSIKQKLGYKGRGRGLGTVWL
jgi:hypothetical protein